jgi:hypothetical protein
MERESASRDAENRQYLLHDVNPILEPMMLENVLHRPDN